jgi:PPOX class probable F420-dependent enzyme
MDLDAAREFVRHHHRGVLATTRADGTPQMSPVVVGVDDDGMLVISTRERAVKTRNLRRDPRASVCVLSDEYYGGWIQVDGRASIVALPEAMDGLVDLYRRVVGEHPDWDGYRSDMEKEHRVLVRIEPERAGPDRAG